MSHGFNRYERRQTFGFGFWVIIIVLGLSAVGGTGAFVLNLLNQPARIITRTFDADNVIYNYEWFKQQYNDVLAQDTKITNAEFALNNWISSAGPRESWKTQDRQAYNQLNSFVLGLRNQRASMVATYNSRASMANRSIFMSGLPATLE